MRCQCCNANLSDFESRLRHPVTNDFLDICKKCLSFTGINPIEPVDCTETFDDYDEEFFVEEDDDN